MNKLYIPGDLVMTNGVPLGTAKDVVYRVTSSDPSKTLRLGNGTTLKGVVRLDNYGAKKLGDKGYYGVPFSVDDYRGGSHTELFWEGFHTEEEIINLIKNDSFLSKQFNLK